MSFDGQRLCYELTANARATTSAKADFGMRLMCSRSAPCSGSRYCFRPASVKKFGLWNAVQKVKADCRGLGLSPRDCSPAMVARMKISLAAGANSSSASASRSACLKKFAGSLRRRFQSFRNSSLTTSESKRRSRVLPLFAVTKCTTSYAANVSVKMETGSRSENHSSRAVSSCLRAASILAIRIFSTNFFARPNA